MLIIYFLIFLSCASQISTSIDNYNKVERHGEELLLCRKCGADVADSHYIFTKISPGSRNTEKQNLFGKHNITVQTLVNPFGVKFEIITMEKARCQNIGPNQGADSWFPGYTWRICTCPHCGHHLGWTFERNDKDSPPDDIAYFHGIILSNILGENFTDSLIMMPKMYRM
ncbi:protein cereblon isoform X1 [Papilio machaon]|uniref:protein cereblon isoform X1 n=1 Tax=Papilio machaon TaxID=76193 RepID=UPI0006EAD32C|nr:protein cereblon isoform X1 [Papilio machaon]